MSEVALLPKRRFRIVQLPGRAATLPRRRSQRVLRPLTIRFYRFTFLCDGMQQHAAWPLPGTFFLFPEAKGVGGEESA